MNRHKRTSKELKRITKGLSEKDKARLMQCVMCARNPQDCGGTDADEINGWCMKYKQRENV